MRRSDIFKSVNSVLNAIEESGIDKAISDGIRDERDEKIIPKLLAAVNRFSIKYYSFSENEKEIVQIFGLNSLIDLENLTSSLISDKTSLRAVLWPLNSTVTFLKNFLPKLLNIFKQSHSQLHEVESNIEFVNNRDVLTVILPESDGVSSSPERLKETLEAIILLYKVCAEVENKSANELSVIGIDSGSDKSFDFLGNAEIIKCIKDLFLDLWDRIVFYRERKMHERLELIAKALPIMEKINLMENDGSIEKEQAEIFRRNITDGTNKILKSGALIPEIEDSNSYNVRQLMAPEPKMLTEGIIENRDTKVQQDNQLSDDDEAELKRLLDKKNKNN